MANTYLSRNQTGNTYTRTWTLSWWFKRSKLGTTQRMWTSDDDASGNNDDFFQFQTDDTIVFGFYASGYYAYMKPNRKFRDTNAWYHLVFTWDSTQTTASDRIKIYVNGVQETSFATATYPSQNSNSFIGGWSSNLYPIECGRRGLDNTQHFDGSMSHCHFTDGTAYNASAFGETDATTGEWKGKTSPSVTYGNNGFFIFKDGNGITDQSGEGNNFTLGGGTLTDLKDNPDNVFATFNPLFGTAGKTYSNGNTTYSYANNYQRGSLATIAPSGTDKFYFEWKPSGNFVHHLNLVNETLASDGRFGLDTSGNSSYRMSDSNNALGWNTSNNTGELVQNGSTIVSGLPQVNSTDVGQLAFDCATGKMWAGKDGTWHNSGNPATGANPTYTWTNTYTPGNPVWLGMATEGGATVYANFGNGYFGTTAVSSAGTNASENGIFEYDVPTGYTALSTKGLNL